MSSQSATNASAPNATAKYRAQAPRSSDEWLDLGPGWLFDSIRDELNRQLHRTIATYEDLVERVFRDRSFFPPQRMDEAELEAKAA